MNLPSHVPSYFLADLPSEAEFTPGLITEACQTLKRNAAQFLEGRTTKSIVAVLDRVGREWLSDEFPFRRALLEASPDATSFSREVLAAGLDQFFQQLTAENLESLLQQELGHPQRLDDFFSNEDDKSGRSATVIGPQLLAHIAPGNMPVPALMEMVLGLLMRSAQFVKCASGHTMIPRMFAHSLYEADRKLGACLEIANWKGGSENLESALFAEADCIVATGSDKTLAAIREKLPPSKRFIGYGEKVSFGYITSEALERHAHDVAERAAADVMAWNQRGCLSPHVIYVEEHGGTTGEEFANLLAGKLEAMEKTHPRGALGPGDAAAIATRRAFYEVRAAHLSDTKMWTSEQSTAWTVILENDPLFQISCQNRFVYVKVVPELTQALQGAELMREKISTVGLACGQSQTPELARRLARWGAKRICPLGQMQRPPLGWRHDGRPPLGDLLTWIEWEKHGK